MDKTKEKKTILHISFRPQIIEMLKEMADYYGSSIPEVIRRSINEHHSGQFRKYAYGYQAGLLTSRRRMVAQDRRAALEQKIGEIGEMTDEELTAFVHEIGFITPEDEELGQFFMTINESGVRVLSFKYSNGNNYSDRYTITELMSQLKKFLKQKDAPPA